MKEDELSSLTRQPIQYVDGTPDEAYPLRILKAYRELCDCKWETTTSYGSEEVVTTPLMRLMNEDCDKRAGILDRAINKLSGFSQKQMKDCEHFWIAYEMATRHCAFEDQTWCDGYVTITVKCLLCGEVRDFRNNKVIYEGRSE